MANKAAAWYVKSLELDNVIVDLFAPVDNIDTIFSKKAAKRSIAHIWVFL